MTAHEQDRLTRALHQKRRDIDDLDIAAAIGGDRTTVSRVFSDQYGIKMSKIGAFLRAMGYRAVPITTGIREVPESHYQSLVVMADIGAQSLQKSELHTRYSRATKWLDDSPDAQDGNVKRARYHGVLAAHMAALGYRTWARFHERKMRDAQASFVIQMHSPESIRGESMRRFLEGEHEIAS